MREDLIDLETQAFEARESEDFGRAIQKLEELTAINPQWEHGEALYNLAGCYEDIGDLKKAEENYLRALEVQPRYYIFVGGYASFLTRHGDPAAAFDMYLLLLEGEQKSASAGVASEEKQQSDIRANLFALGERLGWAWDEVDRRIAERLRQL